MRTDASFPSASVKLAGNLDVPDDSGPTPGHDCPLGLSTYRMRARPALMTLAGMPSGSGKRQKRNRSTVVMRCCEPVRVARAHTPIKPPTRGHHEDDDYFY